MSDGTAEDERKDKVHLPSIFTTLDNDDYALRRASLPTIAAPERRQPYPPPRSSNYSLSSYQFPPPNSQDAQESSGDNPRPRLSTDVYPYDSPYTNPGLSSSASSNFSFGSSTANFASRPSLSSYATEDWQGSPSNIVRPSSTPGQLSGSPVTKYEEGLRHSSFSAPMNQMAMYAGSARISGQDRRPSLNVPSKAEWNFGSNEYPTSYPPTLPPADGSPTRSPPTLPGTAPTGNSSPDAPRPPPPPRKRGKLPKETTDFLKAWLHRHADHPYPSEDEKKQLCHATGLSMSQVSNWMINARRRILAPAHRAASASQIHSAGASSNNHTPLSAHPYARPNASTAYSLLEQRRASMPAPSSDSHLQLYQPLTLQSMPNSPAAPPHQNQDYLSVRHPYLNGPGIRSSASGIDMHRGSLPGGIGLGGSNPSSLSAYSLQSSNSYSNGIHMNVSGSVGSFSTGQYPPQAPSGNMYPMQTQSVTPPDGNTPPGSGFGTPQ